MVPFLSLFYLEGNETLKIITIKYLLVHIVAKQTIIPLDSVSLTYCPKSRSISFLQDKNGDFHYTETPNHYKIEFSSKSKKPLTMGLWIEWLKLLVQLLEYEMKNIHFLKMLQKFTLDQISKCRPSNQSLERLLQYPQTTKEMFTGWFPYENRFTFPPQSEKIIEAYVHGYAALFHQISSKEKHAFLALKIFEIFQYFKPLVEKTLLQKDIPTFESHVVDFKKEIHIVLDSGFSFVHTKDIHFRKWLKALYFFDLYCEKTSMKATKSAQTLSLLLQLGFDIPQEDVEHLQWQTGSHVSETMQQKMSKIHPFMRGGYHDYILNLS